MNHILTQLSEHIAALLMGLGMDIDPLEERWWFKPYQMVMDLHICLPDDTDIESLESVKGGPHTTGFTVLDRYNPDACTLFNNPEYLVYGRKKTDFIAIVPECQFVTEGPGRAQCVYRQSFTTDRIRISVSSIACGQ